MTDAQEAALIRALMAAFVLAFVAVPADAASATTYAQTLAVEAVQAVRTAAVNVEPQTFAQWLAAHVNPQDSSSNRAVYIAKAITVATAAETKVQAAFTTLGISEEPPIAVAPVGDLDQAKGLVSSPLPRKRSSPRKTSSAEPPPANG